MTGSCPILFENKQEEYGLTDKEVEKFCQEGCSVDCDILLKQYAENSDMYRMIKKHEIILEDALKRLIKIIIRLGIVLKEPLNEDTDITIEFDDSIIEDKETERKQDMQDVAIGAMAIEEYRAKWYGETVEQARKNLPEQNQVME